MTSTTDTADAQHGLTEHSHGGAVVPQSSRGERFTSYDVEAFEVPGGREEDWRFTPIKRLKGLHDGTAKATASLNVEVEASAEVTVETVGRDDERLGKGGVPADRIAAQAWSSFEQATVITIPKDVQPAEPVSVVVHGPGEGETAFGHIQIRAERFAEAVVVLDYRGSGVLGENVEFITDDSARLSVVSVHDWADDATQVSSEHAYLGRDAVFRHLAVTLGGDLVRVNTTITYGDKGGDAELLGLYFADAGQHLEHRMLVDHAQPNCRSNVLYKGALQGDAAHSVWIGDVLIRAAAEGTETFELNRNLVLTEGARADSVPNLEIETGEIEGAGHASATGRFDDEQLFYLQARGIPKEQARRLVVRGFFGEILQKITVPAVRERLEAAIEAELAVVGA
ncbi:MULTISPECIES: Fe-S cluster assembly protein SufD [unclassified Saccharopolyspora]|uniref:Fe-S cluster assembly protein SufD n=1 Tax=unclassified Saccharopolyspora TaxID=2646250 RepID=UPI001CD5FE15|nr:MULTISPECIES: Fe-S cluster assembly protein SufD [unclassified Saccharopolyspora]MCA1187670.1 Fe-S cluster assembly protein SufD [Saccharopolyspora sp. 6T]MCA1193867.1 Fe-S cluster assembly protein SufD [Saccharopolyspora sp. 6V]MCA1226518.1 Fe-S cluster assembly protein SufD [Saccharopolyspora sp. 6M]MCA1281119.1 Fe-S cluster assembly protein SufD [Saccharopolyspora sp. 7B]